VRTDGHIVVHFEQEFSVGMKASSACVQNGQNLSELWRGSIEVDTERDLLKGVSISTAMKKNRAVQQRKRP
jgi:hypothetical protein